MDDFDYIPGIVPSPFSSTAAPKLSEYQFPSINNDEPRQRPPQKKSAADARITQLKRLVMVVACAVVLLIMATTVITLDKSIVNNSKTIDNLRAEITQAEAENVRLHALATATVSADKIRDYAVGVLGMQKAERYQIHYFDDRDGDEVVIADGKALNADMQAS